MERHRNKELKWGAIFGDGLLNPAQNFLRKLSLLETGAVSPENLTWRKVRIDGGHLLTRGEVRGD